MELPSETPPQPPAVPPANSTPPSESPQSPDPKRSTTPFWLATGSVLLPGAIALTGNDEAGAIAAFLLAPLGGLIGGVILGTRFGTSTSSKVLLSLCLIAGCFIAAEAGAIAGCNLGGFKMNFH